MAAALGLVVSEMAVETKDNEIKDRFESWVKEIYRMSNLTVMFRAGSLGSNISFEFIEGESLLLSLDMKASPFQPAPPARPLA